jgi:hypothetical protein
MLHDDCMGQMILWPREAPYAIGARDEECLYAVCSALHCAEPRIPATGAVC